MKKLAVFFPGIGYTVDKPLMHYSRRIAADLGYEILLLRYTGFPQKILGDRDKMVESYRIALTQSRQMLAEIDFTTYESVLFIGKSIGTIAAAQIASEEMEKPGKPEEPEKGKPELPDTFDRSQRSSQAKEQAPIRLVLYTPLEDTFRFSFEDAIVFTGAADPWTGKEKSPIPELCKERKIPCTVIPGANHSLETGDIRNDIKNMQEIMEETVRYLQD